MSYAPSSGVLILTIGSLNQKVGGDSDYNSQDSVVSRLPTAAGIMLLETREKIRGWLKRSKREFWQGIPLTALEFNESLVRGRDFDGDDVRARYYPALRRYEGRLYQALGLDGKQKVYRSKHHILIVSGLYGVQAPLEPIQLHSCPVVAGSFVSRMWKQYDVLTDVVATYIKKNGVECVFDLTAASAYRDLIDWEAIKSETGNRILHGFDSMAAGDYALVSFGQFMRDYMLEASEKELLGIQPEIKIGRISFRLDARPAADMPREDEIGLIRQAEEAVPTLNVYPIGLVDRMLNPVSQTNTGSDAVRDFSDREDLQTGISGAHRYWRFAFTPDFKAAISRLNDKTLQGRVLEAISKICRNPKSLHGDTIKPLGGLLEGKWRYRIGDYRLIYLPDEGTHTVYLLALRPRSQAYDD